MLVRRVLPDRCRITQEQFQHHGSNRDRLSNNSEIDTLISKRISVENKAKLSQPTRADFVTIAKLTH